MIFHVTRNWTHDWMRDMTPHQTEEWRSCLMAYCDFQKSNYIGQ